VIAPLLALALTQGSSPPPAAPAPTAAEVAGPTHFGAPVQTLPDAPRPTEVAAGADGTLAVLHGAPPGVALFRRSPAPGPVALTQGELGPLAAAARPSGLAVLPGGGLAWCDAERHQITVAAVPGGPARTLAGPGSAAGEVWAPEGLAVDASGTWIAVADTGNRRVQLLPLAVVEAGEDAVQPRLLTGRALLRPVDVGFLPSGPAWPEGALAVLDADAARVELFGLDGAWRGGFGDWGYFPGLFASPQGLATWRDEVFVADTDNHRVQVFGPSESDPATYTLRYAFGRHAIRPGEGEGSLHYPTDVAVAPDGSYAAVCEPLDGRVQVFGRAPGKEPPEDPLRVGIGQAAAHFGRVADVDGQFLVIAEPESRTVKLFDLRLEEPAEIGLIGGHGRRLGMFTRPSGLALDAARRELLVADAALRRVARVRLRIDEAAPLKYDYARETWVEALDFAALGPGVLGAGARPIEPGELEHLPGGGAALVDTANARVLALAADLTPERVLLSPADGAVAPADVARAGAADLWVADPGAGALFRVTLATGAVTRVPLAPSARPANVAAAPDGRVYTSDIGHHLVRVIAVDGAGPPREVGALGRGEGLAAGPRASAMPAESAGLERRWLTGRGLAPLWFHEPADLGFDALGRTLLVDHGNHRVVLLRGDEVLRGFGSRLYIEALDPRRRR